MAEHGVDIAALSRWMDGQDLGSGPVEGVQPISGGTQNVMLRFARAGREYVLRRGPLHLRKHTNDALRREMRLLGALGRTEVPHPRLIAACPEEDVLDGAAFYLMEPIDGYNATVELPDAVRGDAAQRHAMGLEMATALAQLGAVDHEAIGLGDVGRPEGFLERQVPRWLGELERYETYDGYPGCEIERVGEVAAWLQERRPARWTPGLLHGDYHLANVMFAPDEPRIAAIIDFEMTTVGDPLLDLGWLLVTWPGGGDSLDRIGGLLGEAGDLPRPAELVARYAEHSERDVSLVDWYTVLAGFKMGVVLEGTFARACAGQAPVETGDLLHEHALALFERARAAMG